MREQVTPSNGSGRHAALVFCAVFLMGLMACGGPTEPRTPGLDAALGLWNFRYVRAFVADEDGQCRNPTEAGCSHDTLRVEVTTGSFTLSALYDSALAPNAGQIYRWGRAGAPTFSVVGYNAPIAAVTCTGKPLTECWREWYAGTATFRIPPLLTFRSDSVAILLEIAGSFPAPGSQFATFEPIAKLGASRWYDSTKYGVVEIVRP